MRRPPQFGNQPLGGCERAWLSVAYREARRRLNRTYDLFTSRFGPLNLRENLKAFSGDPDQPLLQSLEEFDPETKRAAKTAIFDRRTLERYRPVERVETATEALLVSLNETGEVSWQWVESLTGRPASELQEELGPLVYRNPEGGAWETADRYLSGNVRAKLTVAQVSEQIDQAYRRNVEALRTVQPRDLEPGEIGFAFRGECAAEAVGRACAFGEEHGRTHRHSPECFRETTKRTVCKCSDL